MDVSVSLSGLSDDGLPPLVSYDRYLDRLGATGCALNLTMRPDGTRTLVGRTFECPWSGALLVEEANDDVDYYYTPNVHFLKFSTWGDLLAIAHMLKNRPEVAEDIRRRGHAFATETYSEERIVGCIDLTLWPQ